MKKLDLVKCFLLAEFFFETKLGDEEARNVYPVSPTANKTKLATNISMVISCLE